MKEIVIISGKGGTGKTSISAALGVLAGKNAIIVDCDVDAADLHILLNPKVIEKNEFYSGKSAEIIQEKCINCGKCQDVCRFDAVDLINSKYKINPIDCEGCGYCCRICPVHAISFIDAKSGDWFVSKTRFDTWMVHAKLGIAKENSGKLVTKVKESARDKAKELKIPYVILDGPPGIGCPVIASLSGANEVLVVTEPTISGFSDMNRVIKLTKNFNIRISIVINKFDLNLQITDRIEKFANENGLEILSKIPYNKAFIDALMQKKTIVEYNQEIAEQIKSIWKKLS